MPATKDDISTPAAGRAQPGRRRRRLPGGRRIAPKAATSARVAAKDIWKPGPVSASGRRTSTITAASATDRIEIARRSISTATSITETMTKARSVATDPPDSAR